MVSELTKYTKKDPFSLPLKKQPTPVSTIFENKKDLPYYLRCFSKLRRDYKNGGAPHKPILLLSIIDLFEKQELSTNEIRV
tara:strand:- start:7010 stop:7252 length:243 start_codon:yes stop_codon:yes gene_type:complete